MKALVHKYNFLNPDFVIASSGSSGVLTYYVFKQYSPMVNIWCDYLADKKFINFLRFWKIIDIDYLVDTVFGDKEKLDEQAIKSSKIKLFIPALNADNAEVKFFSNNSEILKVLKASKAMPIAYNRTVKINNNHFCDSEISSSINCNIKKALESGAKKLIIINNSNIRSSSTLKIWQFLKNKSFNKRYKELLNEINKIEIPENIEHVVLNAGFEHNLLNNDPSFLKDAINKGYNDALKSKELRKLISSS